jgi:hypothetical protein
VYKRQALKWQVLQPNTSFVASLIGFIYCKSANFLAASESLKKAISLNAADEVALYNLAILSKITSIAFDFSIDPLTNKQLSTHFFNQTALDQINQMSFLSPILVLVEQKKVSQQLMELFPTNDALNQFLDRLSRARIENKTKL